MGVAKQPEGKRYHVNDIPQSVRDQLRSEGFKLIRPKTLNMAMRRALGRPPLGVMVVRG